MSERALLFMSEVTTGQAKDFVESPVGATQRQAILTRLPRAALSKKLIRAR